MDVKKNTLQKNVMNLKNWSVFKVKLWFAQNGFINRKFLSQIERHNISGRKLLNLNLYQIRFLCHPVKSRKFTKCTCMHIMTHQTLFRKYSKTKVSKVLKNKNKKLKRKILLQKITFQKNLKKARIRKLLVKKSIQINRKFEHSFFKDVVKTDSKKIEKHLKDLLNL